jgi:glycosyl-4,4'-diaponeurosporenoate acyltransferase
MLIQLSIPVIVVLDIVVWFLIHLGMAWLFTRLPDSRFNPAGFICRPRPWERSGRLYDRVFAVKRWKGLLPDGAALFAGGFRKRHLADRSPAYYRQFIVETCRGEAAHWAVILCVPVFFIWNTGWANLVMVVYALAANMPCILAQRYNRLRLQRLLAMNLVRNEQSRT